MTNTQGSVGRDRSRKLSLYAWATKHLVLGGRGPVGNKMKTPKDRVEAQRRKRLYPAYVDSCERNDTKPESLNNFSQSLIRVCMEIWPGSTFQKKGTKTSAVIEGLELATDTWDPDQVYVLRYQPSKKPQPTFRHRNDLYDTYKRRFVLT